MVSEDLPEPLTPVTQVKVPSGNFAGHVLAGCWRVAPLTVTNLPVPLRRFGGSGISRRPVR